MSLKQISAPSLEPITNADAKLHLRVDSNEDDDLLTSLINAAREFCEGFQHRAFITQTWELWLDGWPDKDYIEIPLPLILISRSLDDGYICFLNLWKVDNDLKNFFWENITLVVNCTAYILKFFSV